MSTFCLKVDCSINHRNGGSPKIKVEDDDMIVLKGTDVAFIAPRCSSKKVHHEVLREWLREEGTLAECNRKFMLANMAESDAPTKQDLEEVDLFARRAEEVKTPTKTPLKINKVKAFKTAFDREKVKREVKLQPGGFGELSLDYFEEIADQFQHVEGVLNQVMLNSNSSLDQVLSTLKMIRFEKNKIKVELGNRENALINENLGASSV